jgi:hypothetical protein
MSSEGAARVGPDSGTCSYCSVRVSSIGPISKQTEAHYVLGWKFAGLALSFKVVAGPSSQHDPQPPLCPHIHVHRVASAARAHLPYNNRAFSIGHDVLAPLPSPRNQSPRQPASNPAVTARPTAHLQCLRTPSRSPIHPSTPLASQEFLYIYAVFACDTCYCVVKTAFLRADHP